MKISLSKKNDKRGRHAVLTCDAREIFDTRIVVDNEVLGGKFRPYTESHGAGGMLWRFHLRFLETLVLAFPYADLSPGVFRRFQKAEEKRLANFRVPELKIPGYKGDLYDYQKIAVAMLTDPDYAKEHGHSGVVDFLNDEMGLGKTYSALAAIAVLNAYPALIAVPNNTKYHPWAETIEELYPKLSYAIYDAQEQSPAERAALIAERRDITIVNIEALRARPIHQDDNKYRPIIGYEYANPGLFDFTYEYAVLDEHHKVKTPNAQVTYGFFQLDAEDWWCPMSGTPILNRPEEIWTVLHKLYSEKFPSYQGFVNEIAIFGSGGQVVAYKPKVMKELRDFLADRSLRRRKDQVFKDLPDVITKPVLVTLSKEERKIYDKIEEEMEMEMADGTIKNVGDARVQVLRLKQACFSPELFDGTPKSSKVEELKTIVAELVASGEKAIIFSQWEKACKILQRELAEWNPAYVTGKVKNRDRREEMRKFNEDDDCHIYIGTIGANREGINLGVATYVIFTDEGWTPAGHDQAIGRSAAGGLRGAHLPKGSVVTVVILRAEDSYEQYVESMLNKKKAIVNRTVERDAGKMEKIEAMSLSDLRNALSRNRKSKKKTGKAAQVP